MARRTGLLRLRKRPATAVGTVDARVLVPLTHWRVARRPGEPTWKRTTSSTGGPGREWINVSKQLPSRLPAGSSRVPRTTSLYAPGRQGTLGVNLHAFSPAVSWARPATRLSRASAIAR